MRITAFTAVVLFWIYIANVICCAVICESEGKLPRFKGMIFLIPWINVRMFFHYLLREPVPGQERMQYVVAFLKLPAKNYLMVELLSQILVEYKNNRNRTVAKPARPRPSDFKTFVFPSLYEKQAAYVRSMY